MSERLQQMILASSFYRSGDHFKMEDVQRLLGGNGYKSSVSATQAILRAMAQEGLLREVPGRRTGKAMYVSVRGSRELLSKLWRPNSIESLGIGA